MKSTVAHCSKMNLNRSRYGFNIIFCVTKYIYLTEQQNILTEQPIILRYN